MIQPYKRLLRLKQVMHLTGLSRSTVYRLMSKDSFPKTIFISERCVGWDEDEIQNWILHKLETARR
jgi:prophage regulatory protein